MSNTIKIKRGASAPSTENLQPYEIGFDTTNKILYINNNGTITKIGNDFVGSLLTASGTRNTLGLGNTTGAVPVANGGTGATAAAAARTNLGITPTNIGAAPSSHNHTKSQITDFTHTHVSSEITNWDSFLEMIFPVGAIYITTGDSSPAPLFSYTTTWEKITDRFLVGAGSSYSLNSTGGAATVTLTENQVPSKSWGFRIRASDADSRYQTIYDYDKVTIEHLYDSSTWYGLQMVNGSWHYYNRARWSYGGGGTYQHPSILRSKHLQENPKSDLKGCIVASVGRWANG